MATECVHRLRSKSQMSADRHPAVHQEAHDGRRPAAALELHHLRPLLHEQNGIAHRGFGRFLIAAEGHVGNDPGVAIAPGHAAGVIGHFLDGNGERAFPALQHHAE